MNTLRHIHDTEADTPYTHMYKTNKKFSSSVKVNSFIISPFLTLMYVFIIIIHIKSLDNILFDCSYIEHVSYWQIE